MTPARLRRLAVLLLATVAACASNDGLKPVRLQAYGKQHYFQIPPKPRGTAVSPSHPIPSAAARVCVRFSAPLPPAEAGRSNSRSAHQSTSASAGHHPWLRPWSALLLPPAPHRLPRVSTLALPSPPALQRLQPPPHHWPPRESTVPLFSRCHDLPEYLAQTKLALARGYAVLVLQANNEGSGCWSSTHKPPDYVDDRPHVRVWCVRGAGHLLGAEGMVGRWMPELRGGCRCACGWQANPADVVCRRSPYPAGGVHREAVAQGQWADQEAGVLAGGCCAGCAGSARRCREACCPATCRHARLHTLTPPTLTRSCLLPPPQGYSSGGTMLLKLPAYLLDQGEKGLRMDGIVAVDAAPR